MGTHYAGTSGDVTIGATAMQVTSWSATDNTESLETTDKGSSGYREVIGGVKSLDLSFDASWDSALNPGDPPAIRSGLSAAFDLDVDGTNSISGTCLIVSVDYDSPVDGVVTYSCSAESTGAFYLPGESTS